MDCTAVYLCASSQDTALHDQVPLGQKHSCPSSGSGARVQSQQRAFRRVSDSANGSFPFRIRKPFQVGFAVDANRVDQIAPNGR